MDRSSTANSDIPTAAYDAPTNARSDDAYGPRKYRAAAISRSHFTKTASTAAAATPLPNKYSCCQQSQKQFSNEPPRSDAAKSFLPTAASAANHSATTVDTATTHPSTAGPATFAP